MDKTCKIYVQKEEYGKPIIFEDNMTMAIILPMRIQDEKKAEQSFNIKEYEF